MTEELAILLILWVVMTSGFSIAFLSLHFRNRRLSREIQKLEAERESLIHRVHVQQDMMRDLASGDVGRKLSEVFTETSKALAIIPDGIKLYRIAHELKQGIDKNRESREKKQTVK